MAEYRAWTFTHPPYPTCFHQGSLKPPGSLMDTEIQVRVKSAALNPVDIQIMNLPIWNMPYLGGPKSIGEDFSGIVLKAGKDSGFVEGDGVFGLDLRPGKGTVAEIAVVDCTSQVVLKKPSNWSWNQAAAIPLVWLTARTSIAYVESYIGPEKTVVVLGGSSATGMYCVWLAKQRGWNVISTSSGRNVDFLKSMGAGTVIDYTVEDVPKRVRAAKPDAIIDCVGGIDCLGIAKRYVTIVGDKTSRSTMGGSALYLTSPRMVLRKLLSMIGWGEAYDCINLDAKHEYLQEALDIPLDKVMIDSTFEYEQLKEAFERLNTGRARGKVVIEIEK